MGFLLLQCCLLSGISESVQSHLQSTVESFMWCPVGDLRTLTPKTHSQMWPLGMSFAWIVRVDTCSSASNPDLHLFFPGSGLSNWALSCLLLRFQGKPSSPVSQVHRGSPASNTSSGAWLVHTCVRDCWSDTYVIRYMAGSCLCSRLHWSDT